MGMPDWLPAPRGNGDVDEVVESGTNVLGIMSVEYVVVVGDGHWQMFVRALQHIDDGVVVAVLY